MAKAVPKQEESTFDQYCQISSCAGVIDIYSATHKSGKIFWILTVTLALGVTAWQTYDMFREYLNGGAGHFQSKVELISLNNHTPFPAITICNVNRAMRSKLEEDGVDKRVLEYAYGSIPETYSLQIRSLREMDFWRSNLTEYERLWAEYAKKLGVDQPDVGKMFQRYGHDCNTTILREVFNGFEFDKSLHCNETSGGMEEVLTSYGRCWRFELAKSQMPWKTQVRPGPSGGLRLFLNPAIYEYPENMIINNFLQEGIVLGIDQILEPYFSNPIILQPGVRALISVQAMVQKYNRLKYQVFKLPCKEDTKLTHVKQAYTPSNCRLDCLAKATAKMHDCVPLLEAKGGSPRPCTPNETINFVMPFFDGSPEYWRNESEKSPEVKDNLDKFHTCENDCIAKCEGITTTFSATVSYAKLAGRHTEALQQEYAQNALPILSRYNITVSDLIDVDIFAPVLQFTQIEISEETPIVTFIGNVGGNLGLYTGLCVMSIIQAIYYFITGVIRCRANKRHRSESPLPTVLTPIERKVNPRLGIQ